MLTVLLILTLVLSNCSCQSVSTVDIATVVATKKVRSTFAQLTPINENVNSVSGHVLRKRANTAASSQNQQRSPLIEIMLRILDTIQVVPKRRSRRLAELSYSTAQQQMIRMPDSFNPTKFSLFGEVQESPLMESSLEQTLDVDEPNIQPMQSRQSPPSHDPPCSGSDEMTECPEDCTCEQQQQQQQTEVGVLSQEEPDVRIYDLLRKILQVFDEQAHRDSDRARRLLDLRLLSAGQSKDQASNDDSLNSSIDE